MNEAESDALNRRKLKLVALPAMVAISVGVVAIAIILIAAMPSYDSRQMGVGAYGFRAFVEPDADLGVAAVVSDKAVKSSLGDKALRVNNPNVSGVMNFNGNRGQTVTYNFMRSDGVVSSVYVDVMVFRDADTKNGQNILKATKEAGKVGDHPSYFMHAQTLGNVREYRLMVVDDLKVYKFVMTQPSNNITINEVAAAAVLKKIAKEAKI